MAKKRKSRPPADPAADIPSPADPVVIDGPTAQELAAHGSDFLAQALLAKERAAPVAADAVMPDAAFQARELMMVLALMGVGEAYVESLARLLGSVHALEQRVFSPEVLDKLKPATLAKLYKLSVSETDKRAKYIAGLLATVDGAAVRTRLTATAPAARPRPPSARKKKRLRDRDRPTAVTLASLHPTPPDPHPTVLLHEIHTAPDPDDEAQ